MIVWIYVLGMFCGIILGGGVCVFVFVVSFFKFVKVVIFWR